MRFLLPLAALGLLLAGCDSADPVDPDPDPLEVLLVENLPADPPTGRDPETGQPTGTNDRFTLFSLRENRIVLASTEENRADSLTTDWDIGFRATTIIFNSGTSGPGEAAAQILELPFDEVAEAPIDGWRQDGGNDLAIPTGAGNGWYSYVPVQPVGGYIVPTPGRTIVVRTADNRYAKIRILSYYRDQPEEPIDIFEEQDRYYTFEYVFQENGSLIFDTE